MKTIASLTGPDFLRACNRTRHAAAAFLKDTGAREIWLSAPDNLPEVPAGASKEEKEKIQAERDKILTAYGKEKIGRLLDRLLEEKPEATYNLLLSLIIQDKDKDGNPVEPDGYDLLSAGLEILTTPKLMDFFSKLVPMVETITGD